MVLAREDHFPGKDNHSERVLAQDRKDERVSSSSLISLLPDKGRVGFKRQELHVYWTRRRRVQMGIRRNEDELSQGELVLRLTSILAEPRCEAGHHR